MLPRIKTILYCTELGANSAYVMRYAYAIAKAFAGKIVVLHVIETLTARQRALVEGYSGEGSLMPLVEKAEQEALRRIPERIEEFCRRELGDEDWRQIVDRIIVAEGHVEKQVLSHVELVQADLVVVGAHGQLSAIERLIGTTTRSLVKHCPVPLLSVQVPEGKQDLTLDI